MENFKTIVEKYKIQIPIIQRDYAQGRIERRASKIRKEFLKSISEVLENNSELHLDFIYGSIKQDRFIPLDGQQRLTTLFLLYWYFGKKEGRDISYLKNFTYETRASSREFTNKLASKDIDFSDGAISDQIIDSSWFLSYWENDPSIRAMLTMIDDIHTKFSTHSFYDNLNAIRFNFFELENFGLDDDLYIKMNARGKSLTDFENFKAKFEKHLSQIDQNLKTEFSYNIDNEWTDFFWQYGVKDGHFLIDQYFMNYFYYITEMLHYKDSKKPLPEEIDFKFIESIYSSTGHVRFLFDSLNKLQFVTESFEELFSKREYQENKICLFENEINLLEKTINGQNVNIQQRILLFIIINHSINSELNDSLKDLLRVGRNLTYRIRHLKNGYIYYTNDLIFEHIHSLLKLFLSLINKTVYHELASNEFSLSNSGITKASFQHEIDKAKVIQHDVNIKPEIFSLEDYEYTKGDIHNFLVSDVSKLKFYNSAIKRIYSEQDSLIIRSMLTIDNYSLNVGWTLLGPKCFFGKKNNWEVILTAPNKLNFLEKFLESYKTNSKSLNDMISSYLASNKDRDWKYYFIKYPEMSSVLIDLSKDNNVYAWHGPYTLEKMGGTNLNAYHQNPYISAAAKKVKIRSFIIQYDNFSYFDYKGISIYSGKEGWELYSFTKEDHTELCEQYKLIDKENHFLIKETKDKDRIEILAEFLSQIDIDEE